MRRGGSPVQGASYAVNLVRASLGVDLNRKAEVARDESNNISLDLSQASVGPSPMYVASNRALKSWLQLYANVLLLT